MKWCYVCEEEKPLSEFGPNKSKRDGLQHECRTCRRTAQNLAYRKKHPATGRAPRKLTSREIRTVRQEVKDFLDAQAMIRGCVNCGCGMPECVAFYHPGRKSDGSLRGFHCEALKVAEALAPSLTPLCFNCAARVEAGAIELEVFK